MFAELLSYLFPVRMPSRIMKDELDTSISYIHRAHPFEGRNNIQHKIDRSAVAPAMRMTAITYAPSLRQRDIEHEVRIRRVYTTNALAS
jgi:hypothetical protein